MKLTPTPIEIPQDDPFKNDLFRRKGFGAALTKLIQNSDDELIISLDARWGEGKTTFVKMWQGLLKQEEIPNIYINAFENDFSNDPFVSVAGAIIDYTKDNKIDSTKLTTQAIKVGKLGLSLVSNVIIQKISFNALDGLEDTKKKFTEAISDAATHTLRERLESHKDEIKLIESFKEILTTISGNDKPLIIIIDELDRCKPTYAVELIEKVKHIFSTKNVYFLLVMHKAQLMESLKCVYGQGLDAHTYLQKFIHIETTLPKTSPKYYDEYSDIAEYCDHLYKSHELTDIVCLEDIKVLATHLNLSLRQLEKVFTTITLYYSSFRQMRNVSNVLVAFLSIIKNSNFPLYTGLANGDVNYQDIDKQCKFSNLELDTYTNLIQKLIYYVLLPDEAFKKINQEKIEPNDEIAFVEAAQSGRQRKDIIPDIIKKLNTFTAST